MISASESPVFVSGAVARQVFDWRAAIEALRTTYAQPASAGTTPPRSVATVGQAWLRTLPAMPAGCRYFGAKLMGAGDAGVKAGIEYVITLFDRTNGRIVAFLDANTITAYRTAATSALALDALAPTGPARLALLGSGLEASNHARAIAAVRPLREIVIYSPTPERRGALATTLARELGVPARAADSGEAAVDGADLVVAAARSYGEQPILFAHWLAPHATVVSIGSTIPQQRELDAGVIERSSVIVCDALEEVLHETGDMIAARRAGIAFQEKACSLHDLIGGGRRELAALPGLRLFKSVGGGLQDIVVAGQILDAALEAGLATALPMAFETKH